MERLPLEWSIASEEPHRLFTHGGRRTFSGTRNVSLSPPNHLAHSGRKIPASARRKILFACRSLLVPTPRDQPASLEPRKSFSQDVGGDGFRGCEEISKPTLAVEQHITHDEQCPPIADEIQRAGNGASRPQLSALRRTPFSGHGIRVSQSLALCKFICCRAYGVRGHTRPSRCDLG